MKYIILILLTFYFSIQIHGQTKTVSSEILSHTETNILFSESVNEQLNITYPVYRVYKCSDKIGQFYIVLTESDDTITGNGDTLSYNIKAFDIADTENGLFKKWELNDFRIKQTNVDRWESCIWFWTTYSEFQDIDNDSIINPVIVYGTEGKNGYDDGRIIIIIHYNDQIIAIRHQNGVLDFDRNTKVDSLFYYLPVELQNEVKSIMTEMEENNHAIFPFGWQDAMNRKEIYFDEN